MPEPSLSVQSLDPPEQEVVRSLFMNALRAQDLAVIERRARRRLAAVFGPGEGEDSGGSGCWCVRVGVDGLVTLSCPTAWEPTEILLAADPRRSKITV